MCHGFFSIGSVKMRDDLVLKMIASPKKSLKIPKGQSESVIRRTDNTMAKRKRTKGLYPSGTYEFALGF
jgi:hypothetical protein